MSKNVEEWRSLSGNVFMKKFKLVLKVGIWFVSLFWFCCCQALNMNVKGAGSSTVKKEKEIQDFGYYFNTDGILVSLNNDQGFVFNIYAEHFKNQQRYEELGKAVELYVYRQLEEVTKLKRIQIPFKKKSKGHGFVFASENYTESEKLLLVVHGSGVVRAGQWSRRLIINNSMREGSQIPYIEKAQALGYGVIVLNSNLNYDKEKQIPIPNNETPQKHFSYVWKTFVENSIAKHVAIVAHSYGGAITIDEAMRNKNLRKKTFAVAFTDSVHFLRGNVKNDIVMWMENTVCNWVSSDKPLDTPLNSYDCQRVSAGTRVHEETSHKAFDSVWKFIEDKFQERTGVNTLATCFEKNCRVSAKKGDDAKGGKNDRKHAVENNWDKWDDTVGNGQKSGGVREKDAKKVKEEENIGKSPEGTGKPQQCGSREGNQQEKVREESMEEGNTDKTSVEENAKDGSTLHTAVEGDERVSDSVENEVTNVKTFVKDEDGNHVEEEKEDKGKTTGMEVTDQDSERTISETVVQDQENCPQGTGEMKVEANDASKTGAEEIPNDIPKSTEEKEKGSVSLEVQENMTEENNVGEDNREIESPPKELIVQDQENGARGTSAEENETTLNKNDQHFTGEHIKAKTSEETERNFKEMKDDIITKEADVEEINNCEEITDAQDIKDCDTDKNCKRKLPDNNDLSTIKRQKSSDVTISSTFEQHSEVDEKSMCEGELHDEEKAVVEPPNPGDGEIC